jgi:hypothetical protein
VRIGRGRARFNADGAMIAAFGEWYARRDARHRGHDDESSDETGKCDPTPPVLCAEIAPDEGPEHTVHFRQVVPIERLAVSLGDSVEGQPPLRFACVPVREIVCDFSLDLRYRQLWFYRSAVLGALSASVALAPGEVLSLSIRNTQRKQFDQQTVDEVERSQLTESTVADKDVLNVTRSSSTTNNWSVDGNGSIGMKDYGAGITASVSETVTDASTSSAQRSRESTEKSASNLRTLQKIQVREMTEVTTEAATARRIPNPYRDRSLRLDVYEMAKQYCVEFHLAEIVPVMILRIEELEFDRQFVLTNAAFLTDELIDRTLELELTEALQVTTNLRLEGAENRAEEVALLALEYLFAGPPMFNFGQIPGAPAGWNENDPASSFEEPLEWWSGLQDATDNRTGVIFSTLAFFNQLYGNNVVNVVPNNGHLAVELAMSLDQALAPRWIGVEESQEIANSIDEREATEVIRRLGGFLTMTSGVLRPLLQPAEEEREARQAAERAEFVINRVVDHLRCHARYYTDRYLHHIGARTRMRAVFRLAEEVIREHMPGGAANVLDAFDPEAAFLDSNRIVVPVRVTPTPDEIGELLERFHEKAPKIEFGRLDVHQLTIPTDGAHVEPSPGSCILDGVSVEPVAGPIHVAVDHE